MAKACSLQPHILIQELKVSTFYQKREIALSVQVKQKNFLKKSFLNFQLYRYPLPLLALPTRNSRLRSSWQVFTNHKRHQVIGTLLTPEGFWWSKREAEYPILSRAVKEILS